MPLLKAPWTEYRYMSDTNNTFLFVYVLVWSRLVTVHTNDCLFIVTLDPATLRTEGHGGSKWETRQRKGRTAFEIDWAALCWRRLSEESPASFISSVLRTDRSKFLFCFRGFPLESTTFSTGICASNVTCTCHSKDASALNSLVSDQFPTFRCP